MERKLGQLVSQNDSILNQAGIVGAILDEIANLNPPARQVLADVLVAMGVDITDFDTVVANLQTVRTAIEATLTRLGG